MRGLHSSKGVSQGTFSFFSLILQHLFKLIQTFENTSSPKARATLLLPRYSDQILKNVERKKNVSMA